MPDSLLDFIFKAPSQPAVPPTPAAAPSITHRPEPKEQWNQAFYDRNEGYYKRNAPFAKQGPYITQLPPKDEQMFRQWVKQNNVPYDPEEKGNSGYDMRGFYQAMKNGDPRAHTAIDPVDHRLHFTDVWKTPYHESFNKESMYATPNNPFYWVGDPKNPALAGAGGAIVIPPRKMQQ